MSGSTSTPSRLNKTKLAIPCKLSRGVVSGEKVFEIKLADGRSYTGIAPRPFCWNDSHSILERDEPTCDEIDGFVAVKLIAYMDAEQAKVEVPDSKVVVVDSNCLMDRPTEITPSM